MMNPAVERLLKRLEDMKSAPRTGTDEWLKVRKCMLTASDIAGVLGLNTYAPRKQVFLRKTGQSKPFIGNVATEHGQLYEPVALKRYQEVYGETLLDVRWPVIPHPHYQRLGGTPDGISRSGILIEV